MLESINRTVALYRVSLDNAISVGVILTFLWLLIDDRVPPFLIYLAQLYLAL
jgi:hypothetical protein